MVVIVSSDSDFRTTRIRLRERAAVSGRPASATRPATDQTDQITTSGTSEHGKGRSAARQAPARKRCHVASRRPRPQRHRHCRAAVPGTSLGALPDLRGGAWIRLNAAARPLRKAKLLGKTYRRR